jgi:hypothetical protein
MRENGFLETWSLSGPNLIHRVKIPSTVRMVCLAPNVSRIALPTARNGEVLFCDLTNLEIKTVLKTQPGQCFEGKFDLSGNWFAAVGDNGASIWDGLASERPKYIFNSGGMMIFDIAFNPVADQVALACDDKVMRIYSLKDGTQKVTIPCESGIMRVAYSQDGRQEIACVGNKDCHRDHIGFDRQ